MENDCLHSSVAVCDISAIQSEMDTFELFIPFIVSKLHKPYSFLNSRLFDSSLTVTRGNEIENKYTIPYLWVSWSKKKLSNLNDVVYQWSQFEALMLAINLCLAPSNNVLYIQTKNHVLFEHLHIFNYFKAIDVAWLEWSYHTSFKEKMLFFRWILLKF